MQNIDFDEFLIGATALALAMSLLPWLFML